jgi:hypothetical protein
MSITKVNADVMDLSDGYAFTGAVTGAGGGWEFVSLVTASSSATVAFTSMTTGYDWLVRAVGVLPATDSVSMSVELGVSGPTYRTSGYLSTSMGTGNGSDYDYSASTADIKPYTRTQGNLASEGGQMSIELTDPVAATDTYYRFTGSMVSSAGSTMQTTGGGYYDSTEAHPAIQFKYSSGNIATGFFKLYRRPNA